jgi:hypothetical protein
MWMATKNVIFLPPWRDRNFERLIILRLDEPKNPEPLNP